MAGNHAFTHPHLTWIPDAAIREELLRTQTVIAAETGLVPTLFRPPYGEYDARVLRTAAALGLRTIEYDLPSGDPDARATRQSLVDWVLCAARPGSIIVMHLNHRRFHTAAATASDHRAHTRRSRTQNARSTATRGCSPMQVVSNPLLCEDPRDAQALVRRSYPPGRPHVAGPQGA